MILQVQDLLECWDGKTLKKAYIRFSACVVVKVVHVEAIEHLLTLDL